jgi:outer membrane lipoprotein-sorting protein
MSIFVTSLFPLILQGLPAHAAPAPVAKPPVVAAKANAAPKVLAVPAVIAPPAKAAPNTPVGGELILAQSPSPAPIKAPAPAPTTPAIDRTAIVDGAGKALAAVKTAQGSFSQTDNAGTSTGAFYISRPGKVRFEYATPEPMFIVSDGVSVSIEEPKRKSYDSVPLSSTPLHLFLRSNVDLKKDGSVTKVETTGGSHFVTLKDKTGEAEGEMTLEFRAADFELLGWKITNADGTVTRVKLSNTQKNVSLKPALFIVKDAARQGDNRR